MLIDISRQIYPGMPVYPGDPQTELRRLTDTAAGEEFTVSELRLSLHAGTHLDAPSHMLRDGKCIEEIPLDTFCCIAHVIDTGADAVVGAKHLAGRGIGRGEAVLFKTANQMLDSAAEPEHWTGLNGEAAEACVKLGCGIVGIDFRDIESESTAPSHAVHQILLGAGICILENLDLRGVEPGRYRLMCFPLRLSGAEASPCRAVLETLQVGCAH